MTSSKYKKRSSLITNYIRPLGILDETQEDHGVAKAPKKQVKQGDLTLFLYFKNEAIASLSEEVFAKHGIYHSHHRHPLTMFAPTLDNDGTSNKKTYSKQNLEHLVMDLQAELTSYYNYNKYLNRVKLITNRLRLLNILDENEQKQGIGEVCKTQAETDPTVFLYFKKNDYARVFTEIAEQCGIRHSDHSCQRKMAAPILEGDDLTYSIENLDRLFIRLCDEIKKINSGEKLYAANLKNLLFMPVQTRSRSNSLVSEVEENKENIQEVHRHEKNSFY